MTLVCERICRTELAIRSTPEFWPGATVGSENLDLGTRNLSPQFCVEKHGWPNGLPARIVRSTPGKRMARNAVHSPVSVCDVVLCDKE